MSTTKPDRTRKSQETEALVGDPAAAESSLLDKCPRCGSGDTFATSSPGATMPNGSQVRVNYRKCRGCDVTYKGTSTIVTSRQAQAKPSVSRSTGG